MDLISYYLIIFNILLTIVLANGDFNRAFRENGQNKVEVSTEEFFQNIT